eukprot:g30172.t1
MTHRDIPRSLGALGCEPSMPFTAIPKKGGTMDPPQQLEQLLGGLHDWRDVQGVIKTVFQALCDVAHAQSHAVRELERRTAEMQEELMESLHRKADVSELRDARAQAEEEADSALEGQRRSSAEVQALRAGLGELHAAMEKQRAEVQQWRSGFEVGLAQVEKFAQRQLRSVILEQSSSDELWEGMCQSGLCEAHAEVKIDLALPSGKEAESSLLDAVEKLASGLRDRAALRAFYKGFGWSDAQEYFSRMGETQVMVVDVDHNDSDDRLAIILLAFQVASANLERREAMPSATATIYLDARTVGRVLVATTPSKRGQEGGKGLMEAYGSAATLGIIR